jgi:DNA-binding transcriptional regulator YhcF (GntR family)
MDIPKLNLNKASYRPREVMREAGIKRSTEGFIKIPHYIVDSFAWRQLSPMDKATWIELAAIYNGSNNGRIAASTRVLADRMNAGKSTVARALNNLATFGFIEIVKRSRFHINKDRSASEYRLLHEKCDVTDEIAKKTFMRVGKPHSDTLKKDEQAHLRPSQSHQRDCMCETARENRSHSVTDGTVETKTDLSQSRGWATYSLPYHPERAVKL